MTDTENEEEPNSDPEDSERPFICDLVFNPKEGKRRIIHLGVLTPSIHHPKLVANLQLPSTLSATTLISGSDVQEMISAEEMKDVLAVSALWLVVREKIGGRAFCQICLRSMLISVHLGRRG